ncbi:MAG TPA: helix-turn-helix domain-containing protein [Phycisphaerae bacterium]|nr:helix-turn-helix domain-containing protein [Phycisphaerae bacterium]
MNRPIEIPAALTHYVESVAWDRRDGGGAYLVLPGIAPVAGFQCAGRLWVRRGDQAERLAAGGISGVQREARHFVAEGATESVLVRFTPWGAYGLLGCSLAELADRQVGLEEVVVGGREMEERVAENRTEEAGAIVVGWLIERLERRRREAHAEVVEAVRQIVASGGGARIERVADRLLIGRRQLERLFREQIGIGPKEFGSLVRLGRAVRGMGEGRPWAEVAAAAGYADQAHFQRQFKERVGVTPGEFVREGGPGGSPHVAIVQYER